MKNLQRDIEKAKQKLIKKAREKGLYENFGQKEIRELKDKHFDCLYTSQYLYIKEFEDWCINYTV